VYVYGCVCIYTLAAVCMQVRVYIQYYRSLLQKSPIKETIYTLGGHVHVSRIHIVYNHGSSMPPYMYMHTYVYAYCVNATNFVN